MTWFVQPCSQYAKATEHCGSYRVQRWVQQGQKGAYEMAFVHSDRYLCCVIAEILNVYERDPAIFSSIEREDIQICIPDSAY